MFRVGDGVYLYRPPVWKKGIAESALENPSRKLALEKEGQYQVIKMHGNTVTIDVKRLHKTVTIDRVTQASEEKRTLGATTQARSPTEIDDKPIVVDEENSREYVLNKTVAH